MTQHVGRNNYRPPPEPIFPLPMSPPPGPIPLPPGSIMPPPLGGGMSGSVMPCALDIPEGMKIGYDLDEDAKRFTVKTDSGIVVVPKCMKL